MRYLADVPRLAADSGLSVRQLERHFDAVVGVSPKQLLRIVRFNSARRALVSSPSKPLLEVAYTSRYADYSHMSRDFKEFFGITPRDFLEWIRPHATRTGADPQDVVFLQDDAAIWSSIRSSAAARPRLSHAHSAGDSGAATAIQPP